ncbi:MAG TPA: hypothetical protein VD930_05995 [Gemmatimonadales bacterium]|nr:hypothetical protein [Gemmatimonadales bacterium]
MNQPHRAGVARGRTGRADVRQALLKTGSAHLYPGIPAGEWQPASVMADMVLALRAGPRSNASGRDRVLDEQHFEFRGRLSAGALDDQRRTRLEERRERRSPGDDGQR